MGIFLAEPRAHVFPTVYAGTLTCKEARIAELGSETPSGTVGDRYHTIVLDPFTMVSARSAKDDGKHRSADPRYQYR